jgi:hypothetical protein
MKIFVVLYVEDGEAGVIKVTKTRAAAITAAADWCEEEWDGKPRPRTLDAINNLLSGRFVVNIKECQLAL